MLVFSAIVPHSPLLLPSVGKEHREELAQTLDGYREIEEGLYASRPDTLLIISPHAPMYPDAFSANMSDRFVGTAKEFGDHGTTIQAQADFLLLDHIHRSMRDNQVPFTLTSNTEIDYGYTVPLCLLTSHLKQWKLAPLSVSGLDAEAHIKFGQALKHVIHEESRRIALIASVDLSHHANAKSPQGEKPEGLQFEQTVKTAISQNSPEPLKQLPEAVLAQAGQCAYKPLLILLGLQQNVQVTPRIYSYEAPFGVGYLTAQFVLA
jgi:aromatic ring-opening dioxygenase LigB subunit